MNTYLSRNHISWPAFSDALKGVILLQQNKHSSAAWYLQSAVDQYEKMFEQGSLLMVEAKLYLATCVFHSNPKKALNILNKAQSELENFSFSHHPLSAKLSYSTAYIYHKLGNTKLAHFHTVATLQKVQSYCDEVNPWLAEIYFQLISLSKSNQQELEQYKELCRNMYGKLIEQESARSKLFKVEDDVKTIIKLWNGQLMTII